MGNSPDVPPVAPASSVIADQTTANQTAAMRSQAGSMVDQSNPYGSLTYKQTGTGPGGVPMWTANLALNPDQQRLFDTLTGTKGTAGTAAGSLLAGANYGGTNPSTVIGDATSGNTQAYMNKQVQYLDPYFTKNISNLDSTLRNQGLFPGQPAYDRAMQALTQNQDLSVGKLAADFEPQAWEQAFKQYNLPAQMAMALAGFGAPGDVKADLTQTPGYNENPANVIGAYANQGELGLKAYDAEQKKYSNMIQGLFGLGTTGAGIAGNAMGGWGGAAAGAALV